MRRVEQAGVFAINRNHASIILHPISRFKTITNTLGKIHVMKKIQFSCQNNMIYNELTLNDEHRKRSPYAIILIILKYMLFTIFFFLNFQLLDYKRFGIFWIAENLTFFFFKISIVNKIWIRCFLTSIKDF